MIPWAQIVRGAKGCNLDNRCHRCVPTPIMRSVHHGGDTNMCKYATRKVEQRAKLRFGDHELGLTMHAQVCARGTSRLQLGASPSASCSRSAHTEQSSRTHPRHEHIVL